MSGIFGVFNTFRLGRAWSKRLNEGDSVLLINKKESSYIGYARIIAVHTGKLSDMGEQYGSQNHNQKHLPSEGAGKCVTDATIKRYGPHKCDDNSVVTVILMKRET